MPELRSKILFICSEKIVCKSVSFYFQILFGDQSDIFWTIFSFGCYDLCASESKAKSILMRKKMCTSFMLNNNTTSLDCRKWLASHSQNKGGKLQNNSMEDQSVTSRLCNSTFAGSTLSLNSHLSKERRTSTVIFHWLFTLQDKFSCQFLVSQ